MEYNNYNGYVNQYAIRVFTLTIIVVPEEDPSQMILKLILITLLLIFIFMIKVLLPTL